MVNARRYSTSLHRNFDSIYRQYSLITFYIHLVLMKETTNPYLTISTIVFGFLLLNILIQSDTLTYFIIILLALSVISRRIVKIIDGAWFKLAFYLSKIIPNILLSLIFFFLLTPLSFLSKFFNSSSDFKTVNKNSTVFIIKNKRFDKKSFEKTW